MTTRSCDEYAAGIKRVAGWVFADMLHHYFGDTALVLVGEGEDGADIAFAATAPWLEANHCCEFGLSNELTEEFDAHIKQCESPQCVQARERLATITPFFAGRGLPGGSAIALMSVFESRRRGSQARLVRKNGLGETIDEILPFIRWFTEDKTFWKWPE